MEKSSKNNHGRLDSTPGKDLKKQSVKFLNVSADQAGQRIDNFLMRELKNVPRTYIYRILRKGEVRVNKKRVKPLYKLSEGESVRIPPVHLPETKVVQTAPDSLLAQIKAAILLEDDDLILINKPSGLAVHGGTGVRFGLIESFRQLRPDLSFIELVHRLDKETSGLVMLAKNRPTLLALHEMMKTGEIHKHYLTLVKGYWNHGVKQVENQMIKTQDKHQKMRIADDDDEETGKIARTVFSPLEFFSLNNDGNGNEKNHYSLLKVELLTGRMHQIRTQLADMGFPVLGDSQYGDFANNRLVKKQLGLKRLFLHSYSLRFTLPNHSKPYECEIPLPDDLNNVIQRIAI